MYIGIDVGLTGAVSFLAQDGTLLNVVDMPTMPVSGGKKYQINGAALAQLIREHLTNGDTRVIIERVNVYPKQGISSNGRLMHSLGMVEGVVAALGLPYELVTPQSWKKHFGLRGSEKDASRSLAQRYYPSASLARKKDHGRAEALLLAHYTWTLDG